MKRKPFHFLLALFLILILGSSYLYGQQASATMDLLYFTYGPVDTVIVNETESEALPERHSPAKAAWRSAVIPGWGQIYNEKYWKLPIVYGGLAGLGTWVGYNVYWFRQYKEGVIIKQTGDTSVVDPFPFLTESTLKLRRENFRRSMDASILLTTAFYLLQIADAVVDAHLYEFDISDDLSLMVAPDLQTGAILPNATTQLSPTLHFTLQIK